ncbi:hypothetical protein [Streptosporangium sp. NPDC002721]|uniref:hypothetical protein n=1 Tax=Streptosporangium sp. NPDC002721 TaxID=3366188 RepID=UPI0036991951
MIFADDRRFWFETLRILGHAAYGGSDVGEVLITAEAITSGNYDSWYDAWRSTAAPRGCLPGRAGRPARRAMTCSSPATGRRSPSPRSSTTI